MLCDQPDGLLYKINLTRQQLQDETSINVKTLNRTISQLKEEGFISLEKGKICYYKENYKKAVTWLQEAAAADNILCYRPSCSIFSNSCAGTGWENQYPCTSSHMVFLRMDACSGVSTPSHTI